MFKTAILHCRLIAARNSTFPPGFNRLSALPPSVWRSRWTNGAMPVSLWQMVRSAKRRLVAGTKMACLFKSVHGPNFTVIWIPIESMYTSWYTQYSCYLQYSANPFENRFTQLFFAEFHASLPFRTVRLTPRQQSIEEKCNMVLRIVQAKTTPSKIQYYFFVGLLCSLKVVRIFLVIWWSRVFLSNSTLRIWLVMCLTEADHRRILQSWTLPSHVVASNKTAHNTPPCWTPLLWISKGNDL